MVMRFFKRKESSSAAPSGGDKNNESALKVRLDYFSETGTLGRPIVDRERYVLNKLGKDVLGLSSHELDKEVNSEVIRERVIRKYETEDTDFDLHDAVWFPRLRTIKISDDTQSIDSDNSDLLSEDGFTAPFSWETKSIQEMVFPSTPETEQKTFEATLNIKNKLKQKKNKRESIADSNDLRTYETIDELRERLRRNYSEAKQQREKYLNSKEEKSKEELAEKSVNGHRNKTKQQDVFKNYKQSSTNINSTNSPIQRQNSRSNELVNSNVKQPSLSTSDSFAAELSSVVMNRSSSSGSSLPTTTSGSSLPTTTSTQSSTPRSQSSYSVKSDLEVVSKTDNGLTLSNGDVTIEVSSGQLTRKNSSRKKRSNSRSSSLRRKHSQKKTNVSTTPPDNNNDSTLVIKNDATEILSMSDDDISKNDKTTDQLDNVMDMLANW